ncbi:WD repeat-containing protein 34-like [Galendromus occidentalis]|uniref:WD repeat-containing protein 34-like n=1 Tax=Galendromus occidentalis TaxID=34638 RepID=A0AAJ7WI29_9ACAR|nr:WD repeat-containing protein 34-like [Galendromus occidentalis]
MFSVANTGSADYCSTWKSSLEAKNVSASCQTKPIETKEAKIQVVKRASVEVQTLTDKDRTTEEPRQYDKPSLYAFLNRVTPLMIRELERNAKSTAFAHLQHESKKLSIVQLGQFRQNEASAKFAALCIATDGNELAVGFGALQHDDWCDHQAKLAMFQRKDSSSRAQVFDMDSCVSCVSYNDRKPIVTCGMYTGEVLCWESEEQIQVASRHSGRVTSLQWRPIYEGKRLLSAGIDGALKLWKIRDKSLNVSEEFVVTTWDADAKLTSRVEAAVGVTCTSFSCFDDTQFSIGTEGGYVMVGSLTAPRAAFGAGKKCVTMSYKRHQGHVTSTYFAPHSRNVFLTSSVDMEARIYSQLQQAPVISIVHSEQLVKAVWSPMEQLHIVTATCAGLVNIYDIRKPYVPLTLINLESRLTDMAFVSHEQIAVATEKGLVHLLQLPESTMRTVGTVADLDELVRTLQNTVVDFV